MNTTITFHAFSYWLEHLKSSPSKLSVSKFNSTNCSPCCRSCLQITPPTKLQLYVLSPWSHPGSTGVLCLLPAFCISLQSDYPRLPFYAQEQWVLFLHTEKEILILFPISGYAGTTNFTTTSAAPNATLNAPWILHAPSSPLQCALADMAPSSIVILAVHTHHHHSPGLFTLLSVWLRC